MIPFDLRLYAIADTGLIDADDLVDAVCAAVQGGATAVQLRDKAPDTRARVAYARALRAALPPEVPLIVNDRVDVALAAGVDGVHLGQLDLAPEDARALLGEDRIVGITVHHAHEAKVRTRVDYAGLGPVFRTTSKDPKDPPLGPLGLAKLVAATRDELGDLPLCAIAGIDLGHVPEVIGAGVDGIAVISALFGHAKVEAAAQALRAAVDAALQERDGR